MFFVRSFIASSQQLPSTVLLSVLSDMLFFSSSQLSLVKLFYVVADLNVVVLIVVFCNCFVVVAGGSVVVIVVIFIVVIVIVLSTGIVKP